VTVAMENCKEADHWQFAISDNGIGIDPSQVGKLFQIFMRLHAREDYEGTGIGLAVCQKIVERHGGRIWIESEPGKGSIFRFTLAKGHQNAG
jgi:signal transduction histidine kinase